jgi:four helix bundle protein
MHNDQLIHPGGIRGQFIYRKSLSFAESVYSAVRRFPPGQPSGLEIQMRRAADSVVSNIAEGYARATTKEYIRFLSISYASCTELLAQTDLAFRVGHLPTEEYNALLSKVDEMARLLRASMEKLRMKATAEDIRRKAEKHR